MAEPTSSSKSDEEAAFRSNENLSTGLASPPYRAAASASHTVISDSYLSVYPPSPAYDSRLNLNEYGDGDMKQADPRPNEADVKPAAGGKVHYEADAPMYSHHNRNDSYDMLSGMASGASSIASEDEYADDDYDWSGDEDLLDEEAKFEERMGNKPKRKGWGFKRIITLLFSSLIGSTFLAGVLVTPALLVHFYWYKPNPTDHRHYVSQTIAAWLFWAAANLLISWYLAVIVDVVPHIFQFFLSATWGHVAKSVKSHVELYNSVKDTFKPILYAASGWLSWFIIFSKIYDLYDEHDSSQSRASYAPRVFEVIEFLFFLTLVICAQRMLSHLIAFSFHRSAYADRVAEVEKTLAAIETLQKYTPKHRHRGSRTPLFGGSRTPVLSAGQSTFSEKEHFQYLSGALRSVTPIGHRKKGSSENDHDDSFGDDEGDLGTAFSDGTSRSKKGKEKSTAKRQSQQRGTIPPFLRAPSTDNVIPMSSINTTPDSDDRHGDGTHSRPLSALNPNSHRYPPSAPATGDSTPVAFAHAAKALKTVVLHDARNIKGKDDAGAGLAWSVKSAAEAKQLARSIYMKFKERRRNYLIPSDFFPAFETEDLARAAFRIFDADNNEDIQRSEIKSTLVRVFRERRFLSRSMRDVGVALKSLDNILFFFAIVVLFFISLSVFGVEVGTSLTSVYSIGIAASFIFKSAASSAFDAIMFLFVTHPYDTGDRCFIDEEVLVVKHMGLFATVFTRVDGTETYYFNSQLFSKFITNVRRSGKQFENLTMQVAWRTPLAKLDALEKALNDWLVTEDNRWFQAGTSLTYQHIEFQRFLTITIGIGHNGNWQDWGLRNARKTAFHTAVQYYCRQLDIACTASPVPVIYHDSTLLAENALEEPPSTPPGTSQTAHHSAEPEVFVREPEFVRMDKDFKSVMGFMPPMDTANSHLTRARKSKSKKAMLRGMGADG